MICRLKILLEVTFLKSLNPFYCGDGEYNFIRMFLGSAYSTFRQGQCESEDVRMVTNSGWRQGPRDLGFMN